MRRRLLLLSLPCLTLALAIGMDTAFAGNSDLRVLGYQPHKAALAAAPGAEAPANSAAATQGSAESLAIQAVVSVTAQQKPCPPGGPQLCFSFQGDANVPGLGQVTYSRRMSMWVDASTACQHVGLGPVAMTVTGNKWGTIDFLISVDAGCDGVPTGFEVTGGTGDFAGASGSGTFVPNIVQSGHWVDSDDSYLDTDDILNDWRSETWSGSISVPIPPVDLTPPVITGAHSKTVIVPRGAKRVRVRFKVRANDAVDGHVYVICRPHSGSLFRIGRTKVKCWADDSSGNLTRAHFTITVKRRH